MVVFLQAGVTNLAHQSSTDARPPLHTQLHTHTYTPLQLAVKLESFITLEASEDTEVHAWQTEYACGLFTDLRLSLLL